MALYLTEDGTIPVSTQSMLKSFSRCKRQAMYKYHDRLKPKAMSTPLERGKWIHLLLETDARGGDWREPHEQMTNRFRGLFDEEREALGDLPGDIASLMEAYFWHYGDERYSEHHWTWHEVEMKVEATLPNGHLFRGRIDGLIENELGLWCVDHKTHKNLPDWSFRMFDEQSTLYVWALREMGIPVRGFIWNYLKTTGLKKPKLLKNNTRFAASPGLDSTDYRTYAQAVREARREHPDTFLADPADREQVKKNLAMLKAQRWSPDGVQNSPFFRRDILEKSDDLIDRVLASATRNSEDMHSYDFTDRDAVPRTIDRSCSFMCGYKSICMSDLITGDSSMVKQREYVEDDPLRYHQEDDSLGN